MSTEPTAGTGHRARSVPRPNAVVGVGVVVVAADGRVLLGQAHDGRWELPGGKVDPGEGFEQAAARELAEETALRAVPERIRILSVHLCATAGDIWLTAAAVTSSVEGTATVTEPDKIARWSWFAPSEIPKDLYTASAAVLLAWRPELAPVLPHVASYDYSATATAATAPTAAATSTAATASTADEPATPPRS